MRISGRTLFVRPTQGWVGLFLTASATALKVTTINAANNNMRATLLNSGTVGLGVDVGEEEEEIVPLDESAITDTVLSP